MGKRPNVFLNRLFEPDAYFNVTNQLAGNVDLSALPTTDLLILNEVTEIRSGMIAAISEYVSSGGNILLIPSKEQNTAQLDNFTKSLSIPGYGTLITQKTKVGRLDINNPLLSKVFTKIPDNPNYPVVEKYYRLNTDGKAQYSLLLMENEDVFLSESKLGTGHVFQLACPLEPSWSNFQNHGLFVPILLKMTMNRSIDFPLANTIGNQNIFKAVPESRSMQGALSLKSTTSEWMPVVNSVGSTSFIDAGFDQLTAGNIDLKTNDSLLQVVAFNFNRSESNNIFLSNDEIVQKFSDVKVDFMDNPTTYVQETVTQYRFGKQFWKACIILALIFLAIEILLLRFWPTEVKQ